MCTTVWHRVPAVAPEWAALIQCKVPGLRMKWDGSMSASIPWFIQMRVHVSGQHGLLTPLGDQVGRRRSNKDWKKKSMMGHKTEKGSIREEEPEQQKRRVEGPPHSSVLSPLLVFLETSPTFKYDFYVGQQLSWGVKYTHSEVRWIRVGVPTPSLTNWEIFSKPSSCFVLPCPHL